MNRFLCVVVASVLYITNAYAADESVMKNTPYLQNPTNQGITVTWVTSVPSLSYVEYGISPDKLERVYNIVDGQIISGNEVNNIRIEGIDAGVKYYYQAVSIPIIENGAYSKEFGEKETTPIRSFNIPTNNQDTRILVLNDLHKMRKTVDKISESTDKIDYDLVIFNGDCIDDPYHRQDALGFVSYLSDKFGKGSIPFIFVRGNHEIRGPYSVFLRELVEYPGEYSYGGFSWGNSRYVVLDCGEDKPDNHPVYYGLNDFENFRKEQVEFLSSEMKSKDFKRSTHRVLIHHIPIYADVDSYNPCYELWHPKLKSADFAVSISGHTHKAAHYPKGLPTGNNFPIVIGGGYSIDDATYIIVEANSDEIVTTMYDILGAEIACYRDK